MRLILLAALAVLSLEARAAAPAPTARTRPVDPTSRLIGLIEYVGGDYGGAVAKGEVTSESEYKEMVEFSDAAARELEAQKARFRPAVFKDLESNIAAFKTLVAAKTDAAAVAAQARTIRDRILDALGVQASPATPPELAAAEQTFGATCATCHGPGGHGDGTDGKGLVPPPRNFHEPEIIAAISPYKVFNTLRTGVDGTKMEAYDEVMDEATLWALAYYVPAWPQREAYPDLAKQAPDAAFASLSAAVREDLRAGGLSLSLLARSSEPELKAWLRKAVKSGPLDDAALARYVAVLKIAAPFVTTLPRTAAVPADDAAPPTAKADAPPASRDTLVAALAFTVQKTAGAKERFAAGDAAGAEALLYDAYLDGYEGLERALKIDHKDLVERTELAFITARDRARNNDAPGFAAAVKSLDEHLAGAAPFLGGTAVQAPEAANAGSFFSAFVIILREGFEAFLIIGAILTLLTKSNADDRKKWIHLGWTSAAAAGIGSFFVFSELFVLSGATRETIEATCTALAAVVLFYVSFWLLNQAERGRWERFLKTQAKTVAGGEKKIGALFLLAFIAVYREAAETVLFYAALVSSTQQPLVVAAGFVAGSVVLLAVCALIMRFGVRLPLRKFFLTTSTLMISISVVLAGKAVKELVQAGFIKPTLLPWAPTVDALGVYQYGESLAAQGFAVALALGLVWVSTRTGRPAGGAKPGLEAAAPTSAH